MRYTPARTDHTITAAQHEHWGLLPTFDLDSTVNIVAWYEQWVPSYLGRYSPSFWLSTLTLHRNKLRLFLQTYELRSSRRLQVSVVYLLLAWAGLCAHQTTKVFVHEGAVDFDIETVFVLSTTLMFFGGLSGILFTGKWINGKCWPPPGLSVPQFSAVFPHTRCIDSLCFATNFTRR